MPAGFPVHKHKKKMKEFLQLARMAGSLVVLKLTGRKTRTAAAEIARVRQKRKAEAARLQNLLNSEHWDRFGWAVVAHEYKTRPND